MRHPRRLVRHLLPLSLLALAACDAPLEQLFPPRFYTIENAGVPYAMRVQYDPLENGWFIRVSTLAATLGIEDREAATSFVEDALSPRVCGEGRLDISPGEVWNAHAGDRITSLPTLPGWQFVGRCT